MVCLMLVVGCKRPKDGMRDRAESIFRVSEVSGVRGFLFDYETKPSSWHIFLVYKLGEDEFPRIERHLIELAGFSQFEVSANGFDVHAEFPEKEAWSQMVKYSEKITWSERCSVYYIPGSSTLVIEYFNSR